jgi:hypothetical protein
MRNLLLSLVVTLVFVLAYCWQLATNTCDGQNLSRSTSTHPIPECRFLPREGWNILMDNPTHNAGGVLWPSLGILTRMQAVDFPQAIPHLPIAQHPLMAKASNSMHNDAYESDVYAAKGPLGITPKIVSRSQGFGGYGTVTFSSSGKIIAVYGNGKDLQLEMMDADTLEEQANFDLPGRSWYFPLQGVLPWKYIGAGMYFYLDHEDNVVVPTTHNTVQIIKTPAGGDPKAKFELVKEYDLSQQVVTMPWPKLDSVAWVLPEWKEQGPVDYYWYATIEGMVGVLDAQTGAVHTLQLKNEIIENSFAVGEEGIFMMSDYRLYKMNRNAQGDIQIDWQQQYDRGPAAKPGVITRGSGSSVTLTGTPDDGLVVITDNAEPQIHIEFYRRNNGEKVCSAALFQPGKSAADLSAMAFEHTDTSGKRIGRVSALVENSWGHHSFPYSEPVAGITRVDAIKQADGSYQCQTIWASEEKGIAAGKISLGSGLLYMYTNDDSAARGWYFTALDVATGKTVFRQHTGTGHGFNAWQGVFFIHPTNGALYTTTIFGLVMMKDGHE